jgi:hypothetical protein
MISPQEAALFARIEAAGNKLIRHIDGSVDEFILDTEYHNGPCCALCGETWCEWCAMRSGDEIDPCEFAEKK